MIRASSLFWFAHHEGRLAWREWVGMMTGGRKRRRWGFALGLAAFAVLAHWVAWIIVGHGASESGGDEMAVVFTLTGSALLLLPVMTSQAMETVTRAFYSRADLDLILSSPVASTRLFAVRIAAMALSVTVTAGLITAPVINVLAITGGWRWLAAYAGIAAIGMVSTSLAVAIVVALFRAIGPKRTRLAAQIVAAVIGAAFVIGVQIVAIMSVGAPSRTGLLQSELITRHAPAPESLFWWPARAIIGGDPWGVVALLGAGAFALGAAILLFAPGFGRRTTIASGVSRPTARSRHPSTAFRTQSVARALRHKEWVLLLRDPWLLSQSLMQLLYLVVPAVLLWRSMGTDLDERSLLVPILIMTAGQLAGGLTWVAVSGEDAPDLIASAPVSARAVVRAKLEAVMSGVALVFSPFIIGFALVSPWHALVAAAGVAISTASATAIQLWFRAQAKRSNFRRRQSSSRIATFAEAFSTISWAGAGAMVAAGSWLPAGILAAMALAVLAGVRKVSPALSQRQ